MSLPALAYTPPTTPWLDILHKDQDIIVVNKPSGLLSVPGRSPDLYDSALARVRASHPLAQTVHRLDLGTSGVLLLATQRKAEANLRQQFQDRRTRKVYLALVEGVMEEDLGLIDLPLICDWPNRPRQIICHHNGKPAQTEFVVLKRWSTQTLVRLLPLTGRSHQLRVHLASQGHPVVGDNLYGNSPGNEPKDHLLLHASQLGFWHPGHGDWLSFTAPCKFAPDTKLLVLDLPGAQHYHGAFQPPAR